MFQAGVYVAGLIVVLAVVRCFFLHSYFLSQKLNFLTDFQIVDLNIAMTVSCKRFLFGGGGVNYKRESHAQGITSTLL